MNARGQYGNLRTNVRGQYGTSRVGAALGLFHTVAERDEAMVSLSRDVEGTYQELTRQILHTSPDHPYGLASDASIRPEWFAWWKAKATPFFKDFNDWKAERNPANWTRFGGYIAYGAQFTTDWDVYKRWRDQLSALRGEAEKIGIRFNTSAPSALPTTIVEDVEDLAKRAGAKAVGGAEEIWKVAKYGIYAVLGIGAVVALSSVASNLRSGKDPAEKYVDLVRSRRRTTARSQLALPPGEPLLEGV